MLIGYARVSRQDQELRMQLDALTNHGCIKIFEEKISGKNRSRPELDAMLEMLREGDTVVVYRLDRISRSVRHAFELIEFFNANKINFVSIKEGIDTSTATGRMMYHFVSVFAELEREAIRERTQSGIDAARARGRVGGRPKKDKKDIDRAIKLYHSKQYSVREIEEMTGVSKNTLYRYLREDKK